MPTTTNFGWTTPADTDLVKDGASAMRTLGNGIDTSLVYLKGGTTGQILSKTSNTDLAFSWINNDQGDLTAITAGTGISVTSGTGPIPTVAIDTATTVDKTTAQTLTNKTMSGSSNTFSNISLTSSVTGTLPIGNGGTNLTTYTTGDLPYASATNTLSKLGVGSTGQVLTVASGVPSWATPSSGALTLISTTTISSVSSQTITGLSTTYDNFLLVGRISASTAMTLRGRFSASGTAATGASYSYATYGKTSGGSDVSLQATSATYWEWATIGSDSQYINATIFLPNQTSYRKGATWQHVGLNSGYSPVYFNGGAWLDISGTAYNEIVLIASTGTISGVVSLYGYSK